MSHILIVDDEESILQVLTTILEKEGFEVTPCSDPMRALDLLEKVHFDLLITDLRLGARLNGMELTHLVRRQFPGMPVIMITAHATINVAVEAMKEGAYDFITKPFQMKQLLEVIQGALKSRDQITETNVEDVTVHFGHLIGESPSMQKVYELIGRIANSDAAVLIEGENGTGKELVAKAIHEQSRRSSSPFVGLNCGAVAPGQLETELFGQVKGSFGGSPQDRDGLLREVEGGTIFLDEIARLELGAQGKLLRVLQDQKVTPLGGERAYPVNFRLITASSEALMSLKEEGLFREDLYYRIGVVPIELPPLRRRVEDIPLLARYFCGKEAEAMNQEVVISEDAMNALIKYSWPGNIRELENAMACAVALCEKGVVEVTDLPSHIAAMEKQPALKASNDQMEALELGRSLRDFLRDKEQEYLTLVLDKVGGNRVKAAKMLGISRASLYRKLPE